MSTQSFRASRVIPPQGTRFGLGRASLALAGVLLAGLTTISTAGRPDDGTLPPTPPGGGLPGDPGDGGGLMLDDEAIGSLPVIGGGFLVFAPEDAPRGLRPSLYVEGPTLAVFEALAAASGHGSVLFEDLGDGRSQLLFLGEMHADFALASFQDETLEVGLVTGAELGHVAAALVYEGRVVTHTALRPLEELELPVQQLLALDLLSNGLHLYTRDVLGARAHYQLSSIGGLLRMTAR